MKLFLFALFVSNLAFAQQPELCKVKSNFTWQVNDNTIAHNEIGFETEIHTVMVLTPSQDNFKILAAQLQSSDTNVPIKNSALKKVKRLQLFFFESLMGEDAIYGKMLDKNNKAVYRFYRDSSDNFYKCK